MWTSSRLAFAFAVVASTWAAPGVQAATAIHYYSLDNTFADALGGPSLVGAGGALDPTGYTFGSNQGLILSDALPADEYTIDTTFTFDETSGYRRIVDFKGGASDTGLYNLSGQLNFYNVANGSASPAPILASAPVRVSLTRDGAGTVTGYVNGVQAWSFVDAAHLAVFDQPANLAKFFIDDSAVGGEASSGRVDYISIYGTALSAGEIATLTQPVPEPATWATLMAGLLAISVFAQRRRA